jgi:transcriptional regulator with XRE-family HTH domain
MAHDKKLVEEWGRHLQRLRKQRGFPTAQALSLKIGLARNYVSILERGQYFPRLENFVRICQVLKLNVTTEKSFIRRYQRACNSFVAPSLASIKAKVFTRICKRLKDSPPRRPITGWEALRRWNQRRIREEKLLQSASSAQSADKGPTADN